MRERVLHSIERNGFRFDPEWVEILCDIGLCVSSHNGYAVVRVGNTKHKIHRIILATPEGFDTDHINGDKKDNRASNLRVTTRSQNLQNRNSFKKNKTGVIGVKALDSGRYVASIRKEGRYAQKYFKTLVEAATWRREMEILWHGEFSPRSRP